MTVYVVQKPKPGPNGLTYDITPAQEFGEVKFIFDAYENPSSNKDMALEKVRLILSKFNNSKDWIISAGGDPYGLILAGFVMCELGNKLRWLRFEREKRRPVAGQEAAKTTGYYVPVELADTSY